MNRKKLLIIAGFMSLFIIIFVIFLVPSNSSPVKQLEHYLQSINQTDFQTNHEQPLKYIHPSLSDPSFTDPFRTQFEERTPFNDYSIGEPIYKNEEEVTIPVTIEWDDYWQHEFIFFMELKDLDWLITPDVEMLSEAKQFQYPPETYVQGNLNFVNTYLNDSNVKISFENDPNFQLYLLGMPTHIKYDAENQALSLPIIREQPEAHASVPEGYALFPDGSDLYFTDYFLFPPH
ncbi:hypothetical protein [Alkalicoccobacillus murimartini]|uniref:Uncharacterized protein n=1 Tax=Alkalicoccobacillus murimartini TaxID=171685 RepID=A0ABT9YKR4_9BACI|nr:hypothetical protein [Alkalicoccobacillus murimartini]MDQ0208462.1 hypothetical protein [Alkalicoccobacillus murimartini]